MADFISLADHSAAINRRQFFRKNGIGLGAAALSSLLTKDALAAGDLPVPAFPSVAPTAKRAIYISLIGAPSQYETFSHKPKLKEDYKKNIAGYLQEKGQRLTGMTAKQASFPVAASHFDFKQHGESGMWISELLPNIAKMSDDICLVNSMQTDAINHEPANQLCYTGTMQAGKPSLGSWISYGLGSMNEDLPSFVVLHAKNYGVGNVQAISSRLWGTGFLPGKYAGVSLRNSGDPVLYLKDAAGIDRETRRRMLDGLNKLNQRSYDAVGDANIQTRMQQYEMAFRMQASVPELTDMTGEPEHIYDLYGEEARNKGSFTNSALMARRLLERGTRFVQIFHRGWDQHGSLPQDLPKLCKNVDQASYALIQDLKQRGMLEDTLVVFGGEFGRTVYCQGKLTDETYGRDHHPRAFSIWMAGGGVKSGLTYGETDEYGFDVIKDPVHIRDLHATMLHTLGIEHEKFSVKHSGLDERLTGVVPAHVVGGILKDGGVAKKV